MHYSPKNIIVAVPVAPREIVAELEKDGVVVLSILTTKDFLGSIGAYYINFPQVTDEEVIKTIKDVELHGHINTPLL